MGRRAFAVAAFLRKISNPMTAKSLLLSMALAMFFLACEQELQLDTPGALVPKTVDQDPTLPSISVKGAKLHAEAFGPVDSNLIICIHGGPGADYRYMLNAKELAQYGYRVVFYDQRGTGLSQRFPGSAYGKSADEAIQLFFDDLSGVIAHYKKRPAQKVFILGHSWGGILGAAYVEKYPKAAHGLVVCEPGGLKWEDILAYGEISQKLKLFNESVNSVLYPEQFMSARPDQHEIWDYKIALLNIQNEVTGDETIGPNSFWRVGAVSNSTLLKLADQDKPDFTDELKRFTTPVLFIYSEDNKAYPTSWAQKISSAFASVKLLRTPGGHSDMITNAIIWKSTLPQLLAYYKAR
jgi:proline iminopeptidase